MLTIENDGTSNITLDTFTIAGLPGGVNAVLPDVDGYVLEAGATYNVSLNVSASAATSARTDSLSLQLLSDSTSALLSIELQVVDRSCTTEPEHQSDHRRAFCCLQYHHEVTNIGTLQDTFLFRLVQGNVELFRTLLVQDVGQSRYWSI